MKNHIFLMEEIVNFSIQELESCAVIISKILKQFFVFVYCVFVSLSFTLSHDKHCSVCHAK